MTVVGAEDGTLVAQPGASVDLGLAADRDAAQEVAVADEQDALDQSLDVLEYCEGAVPDDCAVEYGGGADESSTEWNLGDPSIDGDLELTEGDDITTAVAEGCWDINATGAPTNAGGEQQGTVTVTVGAHVTVRPEGVAVVEAVTACP